MTLHIVSLCVISLKYALFKILLDLINVNYIFQVPKIFHPCESSPTLLHARYVGSRVKVSIYLGQICVQVYICVKFMGVDMSIIEFKHLPKVNVHYALIMCINP